MLSTCLPRGVEVMAMTRPHRTRKHDRLTYGGAPAVEVQCDMALAPFDRMARDMERKWGVDRLPELVSPDSAAKWGYALGKLNEATAANDPTATQQWVGVCLRGMAAMDAEAEAAGQQPSDPDIWEHEYNGHAFGIIADGREWPAAYAKRPGLTIYTMQEVAVALTAHKGALAGISAVKAAFPGAEVKAVRTAPQPFPDDPIPFGQKEAEF